MFVLDQEWGKQQVGFSMGNLWDLHTWTSRSLSACIYVTMRCTFIFCFIVLGEISNKNVVNQKVLYEKSKS